MRVRQIDGSAAEPNPFRRGGEAGNEDGARGDRLAGVGDVFADERLGKAELLGEEDRRAILAQRFAVVALLRVSGMVKKPSFMPGILLARREREYTVSCRPTGPRRGRGRA